MVDKFLNGHQTALTQAQTGGNDLPKPPLGMSAEASLGPNILRKLADVLSKTSASLRSQRLLRASLPSTPQYVSVYRPGITGQ